MVSDINGALLVVTTALLGFAISDVATQVRRIAVAFEALRDMAERNRR